jgi:4-coumarate--CoA ligase
MASPRAGIPRADLWDFLFERPDKPFADNQGKYPAVYISWRTICSPPPPVIFKSPTTPEVRTYADIRSTALAFGSNLKAKWSWQRGDVLIVFSPNSIDIPALLWGCHWAEGIVSPANPAYSVDEFQYQIVDSGAKAMAVHSSCLSIAMAAAKLTGFPLARILVFGDDSESRQDMNHIKSMTSEPTHRMARTSLDPACDAAFLVYSSGTTGRSKGAYVTHMNVVASLTLQSQVEGPFMDWRTNRLLALLPMYHIYGMFVRYIAINANANRILQASYA